MRKQNSPATLIKKQSGNAWVGVVVVLVIVALVALTWWSVSRSEQRSSEILKPKNKDSSETIDRE
jgi:flagellar basal body-associated protein FliL